MIRSIGRVDQRPKARLPCFGAARVAVVTIGLVASLVLGACGSTSREPSAAPIRGACDTTLGSAESITDAVANAEPGTTICLRPETFVVDELLINKKLTLQSTPGGRATLQGRLYLAPGSDGSRILDLNLNGNGPVDYYTSAAVAADRVTFANNDVTNEHTAICFAIGNARFGRADRTRIIGNTIHDCGSEPATNFEHGIYVADARHTLIRGNRIATNADRGVQLYPDAVRTRVIGNLIVGNGQGVVIGGNRSAASRGSLIEGNIVADSLLGANLASSFPSSGPVGRENVVHGNCIPETTLSGVAGIGPRQGFTATDNDPEINITADETPSSDETPEQCRAALSAGANEGSG